MRGAWSSAVLTLAALWLGGTHEAVAQKRQRDLITRAELEPMDQKGQDLYQAVRALRPHFLAPPRGVRTLGQAPTEPTVVYLDGLKQGDLETLKMIQSRDVAEVRYLEPSRAQEEYGVTHSGGAVLVKTVLRGKPAKPDSGGTPG